MSGQPTKAQPRLAARKLRPIVGSDTPMTDAFWRGGFNHTSLYRFMRGLERKMNEARATCAELVTDSRAVTLARTVVRLERRLMKLTANTELSGVSSAERVVRPGGGVGA